MDRADLIVTQKQMRKIVVISESALMKITDSVVIQTQRLQLAGRHERGSIK
jgi:hypothetical protein